MITLFLTLFVLSSTAYTCSSIFNQALYFFLLKLDPDSSLRNTLVNLKFKLLFRMLILLMSDNVRVISLSDENAAAPDPSYIIFNYLNIPNPYTIPHVLEHEKTCFQSSV